MNNYHSNLKEYKTLSSRNSSQNINMRRLDFRDSERACSALEEGLQIQW